MILVLAVQERNIRNVAVRITSMSIFANIVWFILGGFLPFLLWIIVGLLWCITIIGIPIGLQCFKFARLQLAPFGKEVQTQDMGTTGLILNLIWIFFGGVELAMLNLVIGIIFCITIIGIPFGKQCFKMSKLSLFPFGAKIVRSK